MLIDLWSTASYMLTDSWIQYINKLFSFVLILHLLFSWKFLNSLTRAFDILQIFPRHGWPVLSDQKWVLSHCTLVELDLVPTWDLAVCPHAHFIGNWQNYTERWSLRVDETHSQICKHEFTDTGVKFLENN